MEIEEHVCTRVCMYMGEGLSHAGGAPSQQLRGEGQGDLLGV